MRIRDGLVNESINLQCIRYQITFLNVFLQWALESYYKKALDLLDQSGNKLYRMYLEERKTLQEKLENDETKHILLVMESDDKEPPKWIFNEDRGFFDIPFKTEKYRNWVRKQLL